MSGGPTDLRKHWEIPIAEHGISRAIFSTLLNYPVPNLNGKIIFTIYRNKISTLTYIYGIISENNDFLNSQP